MRTIIVPCRFNKRNKKDARENQVEPEQGDHDNLEHNKRDLSVDRVTSNGLKIVQHTKSREVEMYMVFGVIPQVQCIGPVDDSHMVLPTAPAILLSQTQTKCHYHCPRNESARARNC